MLVLAGALVQSVYAISQSPNIKRLITAFTIGLVVVSSVIYVRSGDLLLHTGLFAAF